MTFASFDEPAGPDGGEEPSRDEEPGETVGHEVEGGAASAVADGRVELASDDGWSTLRVAVAAGGGILASAFLGAVGARLGEQSVQAVRDRLAQRRSGARGTPSDPAAHAAFLGAVRDLAAARPSDGDALRLSTQHDAVIVLHPSLPPQAVAQFGRLDLTDPEIAGLTITWESRVSGYNVHGVWADSREVWATSYKRVEADGGQERAVRYVWNDRVLLWQRRADEPWGPAPARNDQGRR
ncbi:hypothetical protein ACIGPN_28700 [Streptomyces afghaniensis]|uniref:hypothetical protein n=1 Tax=Streptomyces afghaniensis TaxID=66865 RepID=UPI0037D1519E